MKHPRLQDSILLIGMIVLSAGLSALADPPRNATSAATVPARVTRIACIGDSITFGQGLQDRSTQSYPARLQAMLQEHHPKEWDVRNFGVSGASALKQSQRPYWKTRPFSLAQTFQPDIVVIKLGTNDANPVNWKHKEQFKADLAALVETFHALPSKPQVWLCHPVPVFPGPYEQRDQVLREELIPLIDEVATEESLPVIDLHAALQDRAALFPDTVHPDAEGARLIAAEVFRALTAARVRSATTTPAHSP